MPAHIKSMLNGVCLNVPVNGGRLGLGTWQGIYVREHRRAPHRRSRLQFLGSCAGLTSAVTNLIRMDLMKRRPLVSATSTDRETAGQCR